MQALKGRVAAITGAGSGIGRGMAMAFAREGMKLAVMDIDLSAAEAVAQEARGAGAEAMALACDVSSRAEVRGAADRIFDRFGAVHVLCNNAGVTLFKKVAHMTDADWDWMLGVDFMGIVYGYQAFVPRMVAQGAGGHIVNTASGAGVIPDVVEDHTAYAASKAAAVALAVNLRLELARENIGVSALCPGMVRTRILEAGRARPAKFGGPSGEAEQVPGMADPMHDAMDPEEVGRIVVRGIRENRKYIFTHPQGRGRVTEYYQRMLEDFD
ncbi:MAG: SDR family NAD(P)-dependent oxidoreductase [Caulobacteraceae bacterium]|nr:SDR family NAD(P)-dependent oxidoreductase [Caulobacteraceae bacterium]